MTGADPWTKMVASFKPGAASQEIAKLFLYEMYSRSDNIQQQPCGESKWHL